MGNGAYEIDSAAQPPRGLQHITEIDTIDDFLDDVEHNHDQQDSLVTDPEVDGKFIELEVVAAIPTLQAFDLAFGLV